MKQLRKIYIVTLLLLAVQCLKAESLDTYLQIAAENNPGLKAKYTEFEIAMEQVTRVNDLPDPKLSFGYFIMPVETRVGPQNAKIGLSQMFPWFGTLKAKSSIATQMAEAKYQAFIDARNILFSNVKKVWYELYEVNRMIQLQEENKSILLSYKQLSETAYKNGKAGMVDVIRIDLSINEVEEKIAILKMKIKPLKTKFNSLLNRGPNGPVIITTSLSISDSLIYSLDSISRHPKLNAIQYQMEASKEKTILAKKMGMPQLGVGLDYVFVGERTDMNVDGSGRNVIMPMLTMTLPIYRSKYDSYQKEAKLELDKWEYSFQQTKNNLTAEYEMLWFKMQEQKRLVDLYDEQIEQTEQAIRILLKAYSVSGKDFEDILNFQQALLSYKMKKTTSIKLYYIAVSKLDYLISE